MGIAVKKKKIITQQPLQFTFKSNEIIISCNKCEYTNKKTEKTKCSSDTA